MPMKHSPGECAFSRGKINGKQVSYHGCNIDDTHYLYCFTRSYSCSTGDVSVLSLYLKRLISLGC